MSTTHPPGAEPPELHELIRTQAGVVTRQQVLAAGCSYEMVRARLASGRWQRLLPGTYLTYSGPATRESVWWTAVLRAGPRATLSHDTAAEVWGLVQAPTDPRTPVHVTVPTRRTVRPWPGLVVHRSARAGTARHPSRQPPVTRVEETIVDLTQRETSAERALGWLARGCASRLTTPDRLAAALRRRPKLRWRRELIAALADVADGCHSPLELAYLRRVERAHGLPPGTRQALVTAHGPHQYDDVRYQRWRLVVELDGAAAHPVGDRWRDIHRDNATATDGYRVLRYGWGDVTDRPCRVAAQVVAALRRGGWRGTPHRCGSPACAVTTTAGEEGGRPQPAGARRE